MDMQEFEGFGRFLRRKNKKGKRKNKKNKKGKKNKKNKKAKKNPLMMQFRGFNPEKHAKKVKKMREKMEKETKKKCAKKAKVFDKLCLQFDDREWIPSCIEWGKVEAAKCEVFGACKIDVAEETAKCMGAFQQNSSNMFPQKEKKDRKL